MNFNPDFVKALMENDGEAIDKLPEKAENPRESETLEELFFPEDVTFRLLDQYHDPLYNREFLGDAYSELMVKLYRSVRRWKIECPKWFKQRVSEILPRGVK